MKIIDLTKEYEQLYFVCLEDWSDEMKEAGSHKSSWYHNMKDKGLRVKLALNDSGVVCGMIEYLPAEYSIIQGKDLYFINCIWVHGHKQGRGDMRKQGFGRALLRAAEDDVKNMNMKGIAAYGVTMPFWIPASFFKKQGYKPVEKDGIALLMFKPFFENASPPSLIKQKKSPMKTKNDNKITVTALLNGYCPAQNMVFERAKRACAEFPDKVVFTYIDTSDQDTYLEWGLLNALFIEDKQISFGPPLKYKKIKKLIQKRVSQLK